MKKLMMALTCSLVALQAVAAAPATATRETILEAGQLRGTMLAPSGPGQVPVVLIIPGSGPTNRDGNSPLGIEASTYRLLAQELAARNIASVRIDKRGMFGSAGAMADANNVTIDDYAADVGDWISEIRQHSGVSCVWLLGHSEGALVAERAAQKNADICGLLLVAAPGSKLGDVLRRQLRANPANAPILDSALGAIDELEAGRHVNTATFHPALQRLFAPAVQNFLINTMALDPRAMLQSYPGPVLLLQGDRDLQVEVEDAERLAQALPRAKKVILPGVNHVLKLAPQDREGNIATYSARDLPLAPGVAEAISAFVLGHAKVN